MLGTVHNTHLGRCYRPLCPTVYQSKTTRQAKLGFSLLDALISILRLYNYIESLLRLAFPGCTDQWVSISSSFLALGLFISIHGFGCAPIIC